MLRFPKALPIAVSTTVVLMGCGIVMVDFGESDDPQPYVPQGKLVSRTPTPTPEATALAVIEPRPTPFGVPSNRILLSRPQVGPAMVVGDAGISFEPIGKPTGPSCHLEVPDVPIQTLSELLSSVDDGMIEDQLEDLTEEYPTRRVTPDDKDFKAYGEFGALFAQIMGATSADQQEFREFINTCADEGQ